MTSPAPTTFTQNEAHNIHHRKYIQMKWRQNGDQNRLKTLKSHQNLVKVEKTAKVEDLRTMKVVICCVNTVRVVAVVFLISELRLYYFSFYFTLHNVKLFFLFDSSKSRKIYKSRKGTSSVEPVDIKAVIIDSNVDMEQFKGNMMTYDETYKIKPDKAS